LIGYCLSASDIANQIKTPVQLIKETGFHEMIFVCISCEVQSDILSFLDDGVDGMFIKPYVQDSQEMVNECSQYGETSGRAVNNASR
jgi:hypothetical protein